MLSKGYEIKGLNTVRGIYFFSGSAEGTLSEIILSGGINYKLLQ